MKFTLSTGAKIAITVACFIASVTGFLMRLPSGFHHIDKQLHFAFYFLAATFFNILFSVKKLSKHVLIFMLLLLFGIGIEFAQENYNKVFHVRFHGRYDPEDVKANIIGLISFSILWAIIMLLSLAFRSSKKSY